jgi:hypothetical protein
VPLRSNPRPRRLLREGDRDEAALSALPAKFRRTHVADVALLNSLNVYNQGKEGNAYGCIFGGCSSGQ